MYHSFNTEPMEATTDTYWDSYWVDAHHNYFDRSGKVFRYVISTMLPTTFRFEVQILHGAFEKFESYFANKIKIEFISPQHFGGHVDQNGQYIAHERQSFLCVIDKLSSLTLPLNAPVWSDLGAESGSTGYADNTVENEQVELSLNYRQTRLSLSPWSDTEPFIINEDVQKPVYQDEHLLQPLSEVKPVVDRYWTTGIAKVPMAHLPYIMQCEAGTALSHDGDNKELNPSIWTLTGNRVPGWGKQIAMHMLTENPYGCYLHDPADPVYQGSVYQPFDILAPRPAYADACHYVSLCRYYEDMRVSDTFPKWYEAATKQSVFFVSDEPTSFESLMSDINGTARIGDTTVSTGFKTIEALAEAQRLVWARAVSVGHAVDSIPTQVSLRIRYYQFNYTHKRIVKVTIRFEEFLNPDDVTLPDPVIDQYFLQGDTSSMRVFLTTSPSIMKPCHGSIVSISSDFLSLCTSCSTLSLVLRRLEVCL